MPSCQLICVIVTFLKSEIGIDVDGDRVVVGRGHDWDSAGKLAIRMIDCIHPKGTKNQADKG